MSAHPETPESKTNSIEIFIDEDGQVTFSDLPAELKEVADLLRPFTREALPSWCALYPQSPESPDRQD